MYYMDLILDCESESSTCQSFSRLFNCLENELTTLLSGIDIESIYDDVSSWPNIPPKSYILQKAIEKFGVNATPKAVCWFHCTRTTETNIFKEGILPLGQAISGIWETLFGIFVDSTHYKNLIDLKENGVTDFHYNDRVPDPFCWGPFAILVRENAFHATELGCVDYFRLPEIIEDICNGYEIKFGVSIHDDVVKFLRPCIVKFKSSYKVDQVCIEAALYYLYGCIHKKGVCIDANDCFDGRNQTVLFQDIVNIEFIGLGESNVAP